MKRFNASFAANARRSGCLNGSSCSGSLPGGLKTCWVVTRSRKLRLGYLLGSVVGRPDALETRLNAGDSSSKSNTKLSLLRSEDFMNSHNFLLCMLAVWVSLQQVNPHSFIENLAG